jgi:hypothetical protein
MSIPSGRELDVGQQFCELHLEFMYLRLEYSLLQMLDESFVNMHRRQSRPGAGSAAKKLWQILRVFPPQARSILTRAQYIPRWQEEAFWIAETNDRRGLFQTLVTTDQTIETAIRVLTAHSVMDAIELQPHVNDFLAGGVSLTHYKFAYMLLLAHIDERTITRESSILDMTPKIFLDGTVTWADFVMVITNNQVNPPGEDPFRYLSNEPPPVIKLQIVTTEVCKQQIELILLTNQMRRAHAVIPRFTNDIAKIAGVTLDSIRPGLVRDASLLTAHSTTLFVISPGDADAQLTEEMKFAHGYFTNLAGAMLTACTVERKDHEGGATYVLNEDLLESCSLRISTGLSIFSTGSAEDLNQAWKEHLATTFSQIRGNTEAMKVLEGFERFVHARFAKQLDFETVTHWSEELLQLSALREDEHTKMRGRGAVDLEIDKELHEEFEQLITDLQTQMVQRKSMFSGIKKSVVQGVVKKIEAANTVELVVTPGAGREEAFEREAKNKTLFANVVADIAQLRRTLLTMRVVKCLGLLGATRFFRKKMALAEMDRKSAHAELWSNRLTCEAQDAAMEAQLRKTHQRLSATEIEIEGCKHQLEVEKGTNSQLVFWKAKHFKAIDHLKARLEQFKGIGDVNISELLQKLSERHSELDVLRGEGDVFDQQTEAEVRAPIKVVDQMRGKIFQTRRAKSAFLATVLDDAGIIPMRGPELVQLSRENLQLRGANRLLAEEVQQLENSKDKRACEVRQFMEATVAPPPAVRRTTTKVPGIIIRPMVIPKVPSKG